MTVSNDQTIIGPQTETSVKAYVEPVAEKIPTFTGWIQAPCENCGKLSTEHPQPMMECPTANREVAK
jgi:hypothetical protein